MDPALIISATIFLGVIVVIALNLLDKSLASLIGVTLMVFLGVMTMDDVFQSIEWNVIFLLVGLMIITGYFADSGLPAWIASKLIKASGGRPKLFLGFMSFFSAFTSNFIDNTTTMLTFSPIAVSASRLIGMSVIPIVVTMGMAVNITGYGTMISDPPQIYLASVSGLNFNDWFFYQGRPSMFVYSNLAALCGAIATVVVFRKQIPSKVGMNMSGLRGGSVQIADRKLAMKSVGALLAVIVALALKRMTGFPEFAVAILFACILVTITDRDFGKAISKVDWSTLLFLIGIFAMIGGLSKSGVIRLIAESLGGLVSGGLLGAITILTIFTALTCSLIINVPYLIAMIAVVGKFAGILGYDPVPLYMALMAAGYSGSCTTMIAAPSNVIGVSICRKEGEEVTFARFFKIGLPFALATLLPAYLLIVLTWVVIP